MNTRPPPTSSAAPSGAEHDALPPGTRFGEFEILRVLGVGGFGIVYLAQDHSLEREVALKEYMPASLAARGQGPQITVRSSSFAETYAIGLRSFVNEARLLARFDHPSLVKVYRFWEDNATAYMVMPFLQGVTLRDTRRGMTHPPDEAWIRSVISPILAALDLLHREGVYHRDIAPDNILLSSGGPPVLLDFGAARRVISDRTQSLTAILKPSYAPIEQYAEMTQMRQGPWTDLYALGAVIHYLLFGVPPAPATARRCRTRAKASRRASSPACRRASSRPWPGCSRCAPHSGRRAARSCARCSRAGPRSRPAAGRASRCRAWAARSRSASRCAPASRLRATRRWSTPPICRRICRPRRRRRRRRCGRPPSARPRRCRRHVCRHRQNLGGARRRSRHARQCLRLPARPRSRRPRSSPPPFEAAQPATTWPPTQQAPAPRGPATFVADAPASRPATQPPPIPAPPAPPRRTQATRNCRARLRAAIRELRPVSGALRSS